VRNAFQPAVLHNGALDDCGYCGAQFPNKPEPDWNIRTEHLVVAHKYGECNQHKKFFRADHFRQHLKHSHGGLSGKWTNILETACVRDEPLPTPNGRSSSPVLLERPGGGGAPLPKHHPTMSPAGVSNIDCRP
jgi:hypothetical protein